jgi:hypothetical protein
MRLTSDRSLRILPPWRSRCRSAIPFVTSVAWSAVTMTRSPDSAQYDARHAVAALGRWSAEGGVTDAAAPYGKAPRKPAQEDRHETRARESAMREAKSGNGLTHCTGHSPMRSAMRSARVAPGSANRTELRVPAEPGLCPMHFDGTWRRRSCLDFRCTRRTAAIRGCSLLLIVRRFHPDAMDIAFRIRLGTAGSQLPATPGMR